MKSGSLSLKNKPLIEFLPQVGTKGFSVKTFKKECVDFHWHFHKEFELIQIHQGEGICYGKVIHGVLTGVEDCDGVLENPSYGSFNHRNRI